jgi:hypothetical protein
MTLKFDLDLIDSNKEIAQKINRALLPQLNKYIDNIYQKIKNTIPDIVVKSIMSQPEYTSLISGKLKGEFGLPDAQTRINQILNTIKNSANITKNPTTIKNNKVSGGIVFKMILSDFQDLLSLGEASFITEKGVKLDWLRWLLIEGDSAIIGNYQFIAGASPYSRTGLGIMKEFGGAFWRVPPEFSGSIKNNWITRAIDAASSTIEQQLNSFLKD